MFKYYFFAGYFILLNNVCLNIGLWFGLVVATSVTILIAAWGKPDVPAKISLEVRQQK